LIFRLFERHPNIQKKFSGFDGKPLAVLAEDKRLKAHATTVMNAINSVVDSLGDPETLVEILKTTGKNHKRRGIEKTHFEVRGINFMPRAEACVRFV
jgi:hypothetical protein